jgi:hypothetical protein
VFLHRLHPIMPPQSNMGGPEDQAAQVIPADLQDLLLPGDPAGLLGLLRLARPEHPGVQRRPGAPMDQSGQAVQWAQVVQSARSDPSGLQAPQDQSLHRHPARRVRVVVTRPDG